MTTNNNQSNHCTNVINSHNNTPTTNPSLLSLNVDDSDNNDNDSDSHVDRTQQLTATTITSNEHSQVPVTYLIERNNTVIEDMSLIGLLSRANSATSTSSTSSSSHLQSPLPVAVESQSRFPPNTASSTPPLPFSMIHSNYINSITNIDNNRDVLSIIESNIISYVENMQNPSITPTTRAPTSYNDYIRYEHNRNVQHPSLYSSRHSHLDRRNISLSSFSSCFDDSPVTSALSDGNHGRQNRNASSVPMSEQHRMDLLRDILDAAIIIGDQTATTISSLHQITSRRPSSTITTSTSTTVTESSIIPDEEINDNHNNVDVVAVLCNDDNDPPQLSSPLAATTTTTTTTTTATTSNTSTPIINRNNNDNNDSTYRNTNRNHSTMSSQHHKNNHSTFFPPRQ